MSTVNQIEDRIEKCRKLLEENPRSQIFAALGDAYRRKGDVEKAYQITKRGLEFHPEYGPAHVVMAKIYMDKKLYPEAERHLEQAMELNEKSRATEKLLAEIWLKRGELEKAYSLLKRLNEADPADESIQNMLSLAKNLKAKNLRSTMLRDQPLPKPSLAEKYSQVEPVSAQENSVPKKEKIYSWAQLVDTIKNFPLVEAVVVVRPDGLPTESRVGGQFSPEVIGPLCLSVINTTRQDLPRLDFGRLEHVLIEAQSVKIWIWSVKENYVVVWCNFEVNIGSLKMRILQLTESIDF
ncbi:MAG: tetratricopeptide repeat protein [candidate division Zixibacteria bacterium]|nr:tetratricopeptide repeat protein [candidate division Zixibacteria bacterium]